MKRKEKTFGYTLIQRGLALVLSLVVLMGVCFSAEPIHENIDVNVDSFNMVMVMDRSGSMGSTDEKKLVLDAAKLFVDLCDEGSDSQISVMPFHTQVDVNPFFNVSSENGRKQIKDTISQITYDVNDVSGTDVGKALLSAVDLLENAGDPDKKKLILFFTDGQTDFARIPDSVLQGRTVEDSEADFEKALTKAIENDITIYSVGANANGSMSAEGIQALERIRDRQIDAGCPVPPEVLFTLLGNQDGSQEGLEDILKTFQEIYAEIGNRIIHHGKIEIKSPNITELNIVITTDTASIKSVDLTNPSGSTVPFNLNGDTTMLDNARVYYRPGKAYQLLKIVQPIEVGEWKLKVIDRNENEILSYSWTTSQKTEIAMDLNYTEGNKVIADVMRLDGHPDTDPDFYKSLTQMEMKVTDTNARSTTYPLHYDASAGCLRGEFTPDAVGTYYVTASISDGYFVRSCANSIHISELKTETTAPSETAEEEKDTKTDSKLSTIRVLKWTDIKEVDLEDLCSKFDVSSIKAISSDGIHAQTARNGSMLVIQPLSAGKDKMSVTVVNQEGKTLNLEGAIRVINPLPLLLIAAIPFVILLLAMMIRNRRSLGGQFTDASVEMLPHDGGGRERLDSLRIPSHKRCFTMYDVLEANRAELKYSSLAGVLDKVLKDYGSQLKAAKFTVNKDKRSFTFKRNSRSSPVTYKRDQTPMAMINWNSDDNEVRLTFHY